MRALLVEDTVDLGAAIAARLRDQGHAVEWLTDGQLASERVQEDAFDLIILDLMLPSMNGSEVLRLLRCLRIRMRKQRSNLNTSQPFMLGSMRSRMIRSNASSWTRSDASWPSVSHSTACPWSRKRAAIAAPRSAVSSTRSARMMSRACNVSPQKRRQL